MKYIQIPAPIQLVNRRTKEAIVDEKGEPMEPWSFYFWACNGPLNNELFRASYDARKACNTIANDLDGVEVGEWVCLDKDHHEIFVKVIEGRVEGNAIVMSQLEAFEDAVMEAKSKAPLESVDEDAG